MSETKTITPLQYLWQEIKMKGRPFTYNLFLEADKIEKDLIINAYNDGALGEMIGKKPSKQYTSLGEDYYASMYE